MPNNPLYEDCEYWMDKQGTEDGWCLRDAYVHDTLPVQMIQDCIGKSEVEMTSPCPRLLPDA